MDKAALKRKVEATGSHFFERSSMKFFGDTMANYYVSKQPVEVVTVIGDVHTCWALTRRRAVKHGLRSTAFFDVVTFDRIITKI